MCLLNKRVKKDGSRQLFAFTVYLSNMIQGETKNDITKAKETVVKVLKKNKVNLLNYKFIGVPVNITE